MPNSRDKNKVLRIDLQRYYAMTMKDLMAPTCLTYLEREQKREMAPKA